jgi:poly(beta-D-mannuronate) lyase
VLLAMMLALAVPARDAAAFLTPEARQNLDMSRFKVTDPDASFIDVKQRQALLAKVADPQLVELRNRLKMQVSCAASRQQPVIAEPIWLPSYYDEPQRWRFAAGPLLDFEERMSRLAGAWVASGDPYYARCLTDILVQWAQADALYDFRFDTTRPQAWYAIESMIFSAALAYSTVTGSPALDAQSRQRIDRWLNRIARNHYAKKGVLPSCCNNHFYRRSLYMSVVGVVTDDDAMFQQGLRGVFSALHDLDERGAFQLAMKRGWRAIHYQNYSLLYLVTIMQVAYRQGYDLFSESVNGRDMSDAVDFLLRSLAAPYAVEDLPPGEQDLGFTEDPQYFSWMEIWLAHFEHEDLERFVELYRPVFNRGAGGHLTLLFKEPERPGEFNIRELASADTHRLSSVQTGAHHPHLEKWRRLR